MLRPRKHYDAQVHVGDVFGRLKVTAKPFRKNSSWKHPCRCECGKDCNPIARDLLLGLTVSCGCYGHEKVSQAVRSKEGSGGYGQVFSGAVFGRLTVIGRVGANGRVGHQVRCLCSCGKECIRRIGGMVSGRTKSCGCWQKEITAKNNRKNSPHKGMAVSKEWAPVYRTWVGIIRRCYDEKHHVHETYGKVGIVVCGYFRESPWHLAETLGEKPSTKHSIDRFPDNEGSYTCGTCKECKEHGWKLNVRWATSKQQNENKGEHNVHLTAFGKTMLHSQWADVSGIGQSTICLRLKRGWSPENAVSVPNRKGNCYRPKN